MLLARGRGAAVRTRTWLRGRLRLFGLAAWRAGDELVNSEAPTHAAAIAYYALLSLFPFLLLLLFLLGRLAGDEERDAVVVFLLSYFPQQFEFVTRQIDAFREQAVPIGVGWLLALIWASLGVFNAVSSAINHAWGVERNRSFLKHRLVSFVMLLAAGGVILLGLALASAARLAQATWFWTWFADTPGVLWLRSFVVAYATTAVLIVCVGLVFYFIPNTRVRLRDVWPGAVVTGVLWHLALEIFTSWVRDLPRFNVIHGSIAAVVMFLLWVYVSAVILLYGVQLTASWARLQAAAAREASGGGRPEAGGPRPE